jgi:hypothetical protein
MTARWKILRKQRSGFPTAPWKSANRFPHSLSRGGWHLSDFHGNSMIEGLTAPAATMTPLSAQ